MRYDILQEPDGTWTVFDGEDGLPVMLHGMLLIGLDMESAIEALTSLYTEAGERERGRALIRSHSPTETLII